MKYYLYIAHKDDWKSEVHCLRWADNLLDLDEPITIANQVLDFAKLGNEYRAVIKNDEEPPKHWMHMLVKQEGFDQSPSEYQEVLTNIEDREGKGFKIVISEHGFVWDPEEWDRRAPDRR